ncbi:cytochrome P450 71D10-like [Arachis hypogaea]|uniref:cytochrome P450 71D10-like n=1 Tax=Arachis hypogaea TaxID=3818 RepID=UPI000DEC45DB|nr:cytochrome P450 71D10-like [Arachis hypogaea]
MDLQNLLFILTSFLILFVLFNLVIKKSTCNKTNLPPGPWKLPLIGNIHQLVGSSQLHETLRNLASKYGPLMHLQLGEVSHIIVSSPEMAQEIMKIQDLNFCDRPHETLFARIITYNGRSVSYAAYGDYWRQLRKICTMELLTTKRVQSFRHIREAEVLELVKAISQSQGSIFNLSHKILSTTYGIAARIAFGKKYSYQKVFISSIAEASQIGGGNCIADLYPSIRVLLEMMSRNKAKLEELHTKIDKVLQDIIDDHRNRKDDKCKEEEGSEDLVDVLLKFQQKDFEYPLTDDNIKAVIQDMFTGGGKTSSAVVEWTMAEMIKKPKMMERAQSEVRRVYGSKGYVDESELHQLIYLKCIIKETLRLHPPVPLLIPRQNREPCQIKGYQIPANSRIMINAWAIGRDPRYWVDAIEFKPERFVDNYSIENRGTNFEFIPFGGGRRMCPGIAFATPNMELLLAQLLYHFDWKLPNEIKNEELDMTELFGMAMTRRNDLCLIPIIHHQP